MIDPFRPRPSRIASQWCITLGATAFEQRRFLDLAVRGSPVREATIRFASPVLDACAIHLEGLDGGTPARAALLDCDLEVLEVLTGVRVEPS